MAKQILTKDEMIERLFNFFMAEGLQYISDGLFSKQDMIPRIVAGDIDSNFEVYTDSRSYEWYYNPSCNDDNELLREAYYELGIPKSQQKFSDPEERQKKMRSILTENGWNFEKKGQGILTIFIDEQEAENVQI
jgi:hypothetical protein